MYRKRVVSNLCPHAPLDQDFQNGAKKLIPMVFCHGNKVTAEEHYGVPMIMASHGYAVFSINFMDGTAPYATGKNGEDIFF